MEGLIIDEDLDLGPDESYYDEGMLSSVGNFLAPGLGGMIGSGIERTFGLGGSRRGSGTSNRRISVGKGGNYVARPAGVASVTQTQLKDSLEKVSVDVRKNATALKVLTDKINGIDKGLSVQNAVSVSQKKAITKLQADMQNATQMQMMLSMMQPSNHSFEVTGGSSQVLATGTTIKVKEKKDTMAMMLPFMMMGMGSGGSDNNAMMMMAMVMAMGGND